MGWFGSFVQAKETMMGWLDGLFGGGKKKSRKRGKRKTYSGFYAEPKKRAGRGGRKRRGEPEGSPLFVQELVRLLGAFDRRPRKRRER